MFGPTHSAPEAFRSEPFTIPSDPGATYRILAVRRCSDGTIEVESKRIGKRYLNYAERLFDPTKSAFGYIREADTKEEFLAKDRVAEVQMGELVEGSISDHICRTALKLLTD